MVTKKKTAICPRIMLLSKKKKIGNGVADFRFEPVTLVVARAVILLRVIVVFNETIPGAMPDLV